MSGGEIHQFDRCGVAACGVIHDARRERTEVARRCGRGPAYDRVRVIVEIGKQHAQKGRPRDAAVPGPQRAPQRLPAKPGATSFIGDWKAPAADAACLSIQHCPTNRTRTRDYDPAIPLAMRTDAGGMRIGSNDDFAKRVLLLLRSGKKRRFAGAGQSKAGNNPR